MIADDSIPVLFRCVLFDKSPPFLEIFCFSSKGYLENYRVRSLSYRSSQGTGPSSVILVIGSIAQAVLFFFPPILSSMCFPSHCSPEKGDLFENIPPTDHVCATQRDDSWATTIRLS